MKKLLSSIICIIFVFHQVAFAADFRFSPRSNKAHLIQWRAWGQESLQEAKKMNKPILLSLSAVWCHWCHIMDETTYSDPGIIAFMNENLIPIRVDADRRPDIDSLYNQGGWPSTVVLTPAGEVIDGGTYISPDTMLSWLARAVHKFREEKEETKETHKKRGGDTPLDKKGGTPDESDITEIITLLKSSHDNKHGGFGIGQKFPNPEAIDFLLAEYRQKRDDAIKPVITTTLDNMAAGEIYDKVEGGFFRYATRPDWSEPHYEKMLDTNAGLIRNYATAYLVLGNSSYKKTVIEAMEYIMTYLFDRKTGVFFGSQDADEQYYKETVRKGLNPPAVDKTVYADSNARMITTLLAVYHATGERKYLDLSRKTTDFIRQNLYTEKDGIYHYYLDKGRYTSGLLSDNVLFGLALIDLYNETGERRYLQLADTLGNLVVNRFYNVRSRRFSLSHGTTIVTPSIAGVLQNANTSIANYRAVILLSRLSHYQKNVRFKRIVDDTLAGFKDTYSRFSPAAALYGTALRWNLRDPIEITLIAKNSRWDSFLAKLSAVYVPEKVMKIYSFKQDSNLIRDSGYPLKEAMYLCAGKRCSHPITLPDEIPGAVEQFLKYPPHNDKIM